MSFDTFIERFSDLRKKLVSGKVEAYVIKTSDLMLSGILNCLFADDAGSGFSSMSYRVKSSFALTPFSLLSVVLILLFGFSSSPDYLNSWTSFFGVSSFIFDFLLFSVTYFMLIVSEKSRFAQAVFKAFILWIKVLADFFDYMLTTYFPSLKCDFEPSILPSLRLCIPPPLEHRPQLQPNAPSFLA